MKGESIGGVIGWLAALPFLLMFVEAFDPPAWGAFLAGLGGAHIGIIIGRAVGR